MPDEESLIQDLREIEKEFRDNGEYRKANVIDLFIIQSTHCKIPRERVVKKISYYDERIKHSQLVKDREAEGFYYDLKTAFEKLLNESEEK